MGIFTVLAAGIGIALVTAVEQPSQLQGVQPDSVATQIMYASKNQRVFFTVVISIDPAVQVLYTVPAGHRFRIDSVTVGNPYINPSGVLLSRGPSAGDSFMILPVAAQTTFGQTFGKTGVSLKEGEKLGLSYFNVYAGPPQYSWTDVTIVGTLI